MAPPPPPSSSSSRCHHADDDNSNNDNHHRNKKNQSLSVTASHWAGSMLQSTKHTVQSWTARKYALPDKHVASQVLMYRQLLHTACRPNLTLSREYQGTPAQKAVLDMPWWSQGILQTRKMIISYKNLVARLWVAGVCVPYGESWQDYHREALSIAAAADPATTTVNTTTTTTVADAGVDHEEAVEEKEEEENKEKEITPMKPIISVEEKKDAEQYDNNINHNNNNNNNIDADEKPKANGDDITSTTPNDATQATANMEPDQTIFCAPVPHRHWVDRLGFQQDDPVTDFRSGGVLSLAMMVHLVESCPETFGRFILEGDAAVLPFGLTCINITDMMAKFLMLSKSVDRMDALLSQKPFWRMFADPHAMLVCHETAMQLTADVVVEMGKERGAPVTVFDFANILAVVEQRMEYDYLLAGPTSSQDMRKIHKKNKVKYQQQLQYRMQLARSKSLLEEDEERDKNKQTTNPSQQQQSQQVPSALTDKGGAMGIVHNNNNNSVETNVADGDGGGVPMGTTSKPKPKEQLVEMMTAAKMTAAPRLQAVQQKAAVWKDKASVAAGNMWTKIKAPGFNTLSSNNNSNNNNQDQDEITNSSSSSSSQQQKRQTVAKGSNQFNDNPSLQIPGDDDNDDTFVNQTKTGTINPVPPFSSYAGEEIDDAEDVDL